MGGLALAGGIVVAGSLLFLITPFVGSAGQYQRSPEERVAFVRARATRVLVRNGLTALGAVLVAVGYLWWSLESRDDATVWLNVLAAASLTGATIFIAVFFAQTTARPESYHLADRVTWVGDAALVLLVVAFVAYGALFVEGPVPDWLGWLSIVVGLGMAIAHVRIGGKDLPPQPYYLTTLVVGVVFVLGATA